MIANEVAQKIVYSIAQTSAKFEDDFVNTNYSCRPLYLYRRVRMGETHVLGGRGQYFPNHQEGERAQDLGQCVVGGRAQAQSFLQQRPTSFGYSPRFS